MQEQNEVLRIENLSIIYKTDLETVYAVNGISFALKSGETIGLVSIQAQILNLLMDLQEQLGLTYLFITHDLSVVKHISDEIMVMYLGKCVEMAPSAEIFRNPVHPYTQALLAAIPVPSIESAHKKRKLLQGEVTSPVNPVPGCRFAARCPYASAGCTGADIELREVAPGHYAACCMDR